MFLEHEISPTVEAIKKLIRGEPVQFKPLHLGKGAFSIHLNNDLTKKLNKAVRLGKGLRISLDGDTIRHNVQHGKGWKEIFQKMRRSKKGGSIWDDMRNALDPNRNGATQFFTKTLPSTLIHQAIPALTGALGAAGAEILAPELGPISGAAGGMAGKAAGDQLANLIGNKTGYGFHYLPLHLNTDEHAKLVSGKGVKIHPHHSFHRESPMHLAVLKPKTYLDLSDAHSKGKHHMLKFKKGEGFWDDLKNGVNRVYHKVIKPTIKNVLMPHAGQYAGRELGRTIAQLSGLPPEAGAMIGEYAGKKVGELVAHETIGEGVKRKRGRPRKGGALFPAGGSVGGALFPAGEFTGGALFPAGGALYPAGHKN